MTVLVSLSNGDEFYVDAELIRVASHLYHGRRRDAGFADHLVYLGNRLVNPRQVAQLQAVRDYPSIFTPETLEEPDA